MLKTIIPVILLLLTLGVAFGQGQPIYQSPNILPPSPNAAALGRYGLIPVNLPTGSVNASIPLYELKTRNLSFPVSISYYSNGVRVDDIASSVGMGWSLNCGGVISRVVRDDPDEAGYFNTRYPENFSGTDAETLKYIEMLGNNEGVDSEPDLYTFNFAGWTGKFVYDRSGRPVLMPHANLVIERSLGQFGAFTVITPDGVKYFFTEGESSETMPANDNKNYGTVETSWYLTRIEHPQGDVINLSYSYIHSYQYYTSISQTLNRQVAYESCGGETPQCSVIPDQTVANGLQVNGRHLSKVEAVGYGSIEINASLTRQDLDFYKVDGIVVKNANNTVISQFDFLYSMNVHRMFLTDLLEKDVNGYVVKKHQFEYKNPQLLPARLSFAQDHWGYFNGANNHDFVPKDLNTRNQLGQFVFQGRGGDREPNAQHSGQGLLTKITYPTGGSTTFTYEPNTYFGAKTVYPSPTLHSLSAHGEESANFPFVKYSSPITSPITQSVEIAYSVGLLGGQADPGIGAQLLIDGPGNNDFSANLRPGEVTYTVFQMFANQTYDVSIVINAPQLTAGVTFHYFATAPTVSSENIETGGLRIAQSVNHDPVANSSETFRYYYGKHDDLSKSTGAVYTSPSYHTQFLTKSACSIPIQQYTCNYVALSSNSINNLFRANGADVYYGYVCISKETQGFGTGLEEHQFDLNFDLPGLQKWGSSYVNATPSTNTGWNHGKERFVRTFKYEEGVFTLVRQVENVYAADNRLYAEVPALVVRKKFSPLANQDVTFTCDTENTQAHRNIYGCVANHNHWLRTPFPWEAQHIFCFRPDAEMAIVQTIVHPCYQKPIGSIQTAPYNLDYLDAIEYRNISHWVYLQKVIETNYDRNGLNPHVTETLYSYENPVHAELTRTSTTRSDGRSQETIITYPDDYLIAGDLELVQLQHGRVVSLPIKQETFVSGKQISGMVVKRNAKGQSIEVYNYEASTPQDPVPHNPNVLIPSTDYKKRSTMNYDPQTSALIGVTQTDGIAKSYLWGYSGTLPIAEVVNATLSQTSESVLIRQPISGVSSQTETPIMHGVKIDFQQDVVISIDMANVYPPYQGSQNLDMRLQFSSATNTQSFTFSYTSAMSHQEITLSNLVPGTYTLTYLGKTHANDPSYNFTGRVNYMTTKTSSTIFHTSFEDLELFTSSDARTGNKSKIGKFVVTTPKTPGEYLITYWQKDPGQGDWTFHSLVSTITTGLEAGTEIGTENWLLDEVRMYPVNARMKTFTYEPLVGVTSVMDENNIASYYEYDSFGRLKYIRDDNRNIVKSHSYKFTSGE